MPITQGRGHPRLIKEECREPELVWEKTWQTALYRNTYVRPGAAATGTDRRRGQVTFRGGDVCVP